MNADPSPHENDRAAAVPNSGVPDSPAGQFPADSTRPGLLQRLPAAPRKVAIVRASRIGDFICATPAFRALRAALPHAEMVLIGLPFVAGLVDRSPYLDRFVEFPGFPGIAEQFFDAGRAVSFFAQMQREDFDLAIQMNGSGVYSNPFTLMLGARVTAGMIQPGNDPGLLAAAFPFPGRGHQVRRLLDFARFLGAEPQGVDLDFPLWPRDYRDADDLLAGWPGPFIALHPGARDLPKRWPPEHFAAVGSVLRREMGGTVAIIGSEEDRMLADHVEELAGGPCLNLAGRTSLGALGGVISRLALLVTNDSGPAHIAYALGTPSVTIFSDTDPEEWGPIQAGAHEIVAVPCDNSRYDDGASAGAATQVNVEEVLAACRRALARASTQQSAQYPPALTRGAEA